MSISFVMLVCPYCDSHIKEEDVIEDYEVMRGFCPKCGSILCDLVKHNDNEKVVFT